MKRSKSTEDDWQGTAYIGLGWGVFHGRAGDNHAHYHQAIQILLSSTPKKVWLRDKGWSTSHGIIIGANHLHQFGNTHDVVTLIYVDPTSLPGKQLNATLQNGYRILGEVETTGALHHLQTHDKSSSPTELLHPLISELIPQYPQVDDDLIETLLARLPVRPGNKFGASDLYRWSGLSSSRLQHRFRQHTGLPIRAYLLWWRLLLALQVVSQGMSLSTAAHDAGFSDAAHCTRTFRRYFGIAPKNLRGIRFTTRI